MKATRHEMHKSMLGLRNLKHVRDEEHKCKQGTTHEQPENTQGTGDVRYARTRKTRGHVRHKST